MVNIEEVSAAMEADSLALFTKVRTSMHGAFLRAHAEIGSISAWSAKDMEYLDAIDTKIVEMFQRTGATFASKVKNEIQKAETEARKFVTAAGAEIEKLVTPAPKATPREPINPPEVETVARDVPNASVRER